MNDAGKAMRDEKARMLAEQAERRERDKPKGQLAYARALLARLEEIKPNTPAAIRMEGPPAGAFDPIPQKDPAPVVGCFADLLDDNQGAHHDDQEKETAEQKPIPPDEEPFG